MNEYKEGDIIKISGIEVSYLYKIEKMGTSKEANRFKAFVINIETGDFIAFNNLSIFNIRLATKEEIAIHISKKMKG